jgi:hypothetical protein
MTAVPSRLVVINVRLVELRPPPMTDDWMCSIGRIIIDKGETKYSENCLSQGNFVHYRSCMDCPRIESSNKPAVYRLSYDVTKTGHPFAHRPTSNVFGFYGFVTGVRWMESWEREKRSFTTNSPASKKPK